MKWRLKLSDVVIVASIMLCFVELFLAKRDKTIGLIFPVVVLFVGQILFRDAVSAFFRNIGLIDGAVMLAIYFFVLLTNKKTV